MKTKQLITGVFSILAMSCFTLTFTGCSNDDDGERQTTVAYRVAEILSTETSGSNLYEDKTLYTYIDERLTEVINLDKENGTWEDDRKTEFEYNGDWVSSTRYDKEGNDWVYQDMQSSQEMKIVNGKVMEIRESSFNYSYREVFTYSGDKIINVDRFYNGELHYKLVITYNGDNLDEIIEYDYDNGTEELDYKYEFSYTNGNLTEVLGFYYGEGVWNNSDRDVYTYSGNKVTKIDDYDYYNDSWELDDSEYYTYNSMGLLESISESGQGWTWEEIYTYEDGIGNYKLLYGDGGYYDVFNYPTAQRMSETSAGADDRKFNIKRFLLH
jgi:hypothetical protein